MAGRGQRTLAFSRDGRTLLSAESDNNSPRELRARLRVWEVTTGKQVRDQLLLNAKGAGGLSTFVFSPDGKILASLHRSNAVSLWEVATGKELHHLTVGNGRFLGNRPPHAGAFSPDNRFLVVSNFFISNFNNVDHRNDGAVHLLEVSTGKEVRKWMPDKMGTYSVAFSPDGKLLATGSAFGPIRLWEAATGKELRQCQGYRAHVVALTFSPNSSTLASLAGLHDHTARLWEVASGKELTPTSRGHGGPVLSLAFSSDGKSLISGDRDGLVGFWDAQTGQQQHPFLRAGDFQALAALSPDGKTILTAGSTFSPNGQNQLEAALQTPILVCVWDRATGQKLRQFKGPEEGAVQSLVLSPDGKVLASAGRDSTVCLWEAATGQQRRRLAGHGGEVWCLAFGPDGRRLAAGSNDTTTLVWDVTGLWASVSTATEIRTFRGHEKGINDASCVYTVAFSPDGKTLASGGGDWTVRLWEMATGKEIRTLHGHIFGVCSVAFAPDSKTVASGGSDNTVRLREVATGKGICPPRGHTGSGVRGVAFAPDGKTIDTAGYEDKTARLWEAATGKEIHTLLGHRSSCYGVAFSPDSKILASVGSGGTVRLWSTATSKEIRNLKGHRGEILSVVFSPDGKTLASRGDTIRLWEAATGKEIRTLQGGQDGTVSSVSFSPDGKTLVSGAWTDERVWLWDVATGREIRTIKAHPGNPTEGPAGAIAVAFAPDGKTVASGGRGNSVRLWDITTGKEIRAFHVESLVFGVAFSPDERTLAAATAHNFRLWDLRGDRVFPPLAADPRGGSRPIGGDGVAFSPDGKTLVSANGDDTGLVWELNLVPTTRRRNEETVP